MARLSNKPSEVTCFVADEAMPEKLQAVGLALALLRRVKQPTWDELVASVKRGDEATVNEMAACHLDEDQLALLSTHAGLVRHVSTRAPMRNVAQCEDCSEVLVFAQACPKKCALTRGCDGDNVKAPVAKVVRVAADELESVPDPGGGVAGTDGWGARPRGSNVLNVSAVVADADEIDWDDGVNFVEGDVDP